MIKEVKNTVPWTDVINDLNGDGIIAKELQKTNQQKFRVKNVIKKKCTITKKIVTYLLMVQKFINLNQKILKFLKFIMFRKHFKRLVSR